MFSERVEQGFELVGGKYIFLIFEVGLELIVAHAPRSDVEVAGEFNVEQHRTVPVHLQALSRHQRVPGVVDARGSVSFA